MSKDINKRIAAEISWARTYDRSARTRPAREAFLKRFEREVDPAMASSHPTNAPAAAARTETPAAGHHLCSKLADFTSNTPTDGMIPLLEP